jgi:hypothetical protein
MSFIALAAYINIFVFLFPPFRQYGGKYFLFFLVLALGDPFIIIVVELIHLNGPNVVCLIAWAAFFSVTKIANSRKGLIILSIFTVILIIAVIFINGSDASFLAILINFLTLSYFIREAAQYYSATNDFHLGYFMLVLYLIGIITKLYVMAGHTQLGILYFYITDIFEFFIALFFTIYKVERSPVLKLKKALR